MEKTWGQIEHDIDLKIEHQVFSERLIVILATVSSIAALSGAPKAWAMLWALPLLGYLLGRHITENLRYQHSDYWLLALGSQVLLALIVGTVITTDF